MTEDENYHKIKLQMLDARVNFKPPRCTFKHAGLWTMQDQSCVILGHDANFAQYVRTPIKGRNDHVISLFMARRHELQSVSSVREEKVR